MQRLTCSRAGCQSHVAMFATRVFYCGDTMDAQARWTTGQLSAPGEQLTQFCVPGTASVSKSYKIRAVFRVHGEVSRSSMGQGNPPLCILSVAEVLE
jgi:hypothetical protein